MLFQLSCIKLFDESTLGVSNQGKKSKFCTILDMCQPVLTLLGVEIRIVHFMTNRNVFWRFKSRSAYIS